jgi:hexosaminidase
LPRYAALCEVQWLQPEKKNYESFLKRLPQLIALYEKLGYDFATHVFDVKTTLAVNFDRNALDVSFSTIDNAPIYYTLDGTEPTQSSLLYEEKLSFKENAEIKATAIREGKKSKIFSEKLLVSKSSFMPIELLTSPAENYTYGGAPMLVDGLNGSNTNYRSGRWIGFPGVDLVAVIDMLQPTEISNAEVRNAVVTGDWIFDASEIIIEASDNNKTFTSVATLAITDEHTDNWSDISVHSLSFEPVTARYFKVTVKPSNIADWHVGKGRRAYIFVDEIRLN